MKNRIALKLMAYFTAALLLFALMVGALFLAFFSRHTVNVQRDELKKRATAMASTLTDYMDNQALGNMMGKGQGGYGMYLRMLNIIAMTDVWIVDEDLQLLTAQQRTANSLTYSDLPADADELVKQVFQGEVPFSEGFSSLLGAPTLTVGAPIYRDGSVVGALLLHDAVSGMKEASDQGIQILLYSTLAALLISVVPALLLSLSLARPLNRMKGTAQQLAQGNYDVKTEIVQKDEIGKLASAIDALSGRLREAREERNRQEQLRSDFLANIAHELRTPVAVLRGSLEALADGVVTEPGQVEEYHRQMLKDTQGLNRLVNDLLDLSRLSSADFPMEKETFSLNEVLSDVLRSAGQMAREKDIRIYREFPSAPIPFQGDYGRLKQMFLTVLDNAVKFSSEGGTVSVTLDAKEAVIKDEGPGIAPEELPYIFDRFRKSRTEENRQGSGLGLAIAKKIAGRHNISILVDSELGKGTAFTFRWGEESENSEEG